MRFSLSTSVWKQRKIFETDCHLIASDDEVPGGPLSASAHTGGKAFGRWSDLAYSRSHSRWIFIWNRVSNLELARPEARPSPLGHAAPHRDEIQLKKDTVQQRIQDYF
ncbi:hypothetical protein AVEN_122127-1 [Araneus ventricosus]|uniref:Uncharacterized protein n=1 Tax=Araneus ventricosus TaxID=182803 RepID=A0A4Y2CWL1_ARAVE|nr:hypothetical protein AVEN_122127-1 [Araneus ventricosus]